MNKCSRAILLFPRRNFNPGTDWTAAAAGFNLFSYIYIYLLAFPIYIPAADRFHMLYTAAASAALYSVSSSLYICCCCLLSPDPPPSSCPAFPYIIKVSAAASIIIVRHSAAERRHSRPYKVSTSSVCRLISITQRRPIHIYFRYRCCCCSTTVCTVNKVCNIKCSCSFQSICSACCWGTHII